MAKLAKQNCIVIIECDRLDAKLVKFLTLSIGGLCENLLFHQLFVIHLRTVIMHSWSYLSLALLDIQNMVVYLHLLDLMFYKTYNFYELFHRYDSF